MYKWRSAYKIHVIINFITYPEAIHLTRAGKRKRVKAPREQAKNIIKCVRFVRKINANTEENYYEKYGIVFVKKWLECASKLFNFYFTFFNDQLVEIST